ncbi:SAV0927 family protein [Bacillaceae bacterium W0354]
MEEKYLKDIKEHADLRYVSFMSDIKRHDLAILNSPSLQDKDEIVLIDLNSQRYCVIRKNRLDDIEYIAHTLNVNEYEAEDLLTYLKELIV